MKLNRYIYTSLLIVLLMGWGCLLVACSDQVETDIEQPKEPQPEQPTGEPLRVVSLTRDAGDTDDTNDPMKGEYVHLFLLAQGETTPLSGTVLYNGKDDTSTGSDIVWVSGNALYVKPGKDYEVFGFLPATEATTTGTDAPTISISSTKAIMNIKNLNAVSTKDICVVIGANTVGQTITRGVFNYHAPENTETGYGVDLLVDHLYASALFQFKVHADYDKLRTIKLRKVTMKLKTGRTLPAKVNATVTLTKGAASPLEITLSPVAESGSVSPVLLFENNTGGNPGQALKVDETINMAAYFNPAYKGDLVLESLYDVYDKHGNKTRENCKAENDLSSLLNVETTVRGAQKVIPLTVRPTYLYVLSEPDWDYDIPSVETE